MRKAVLLLVPLAAACSSAPRLTESQEYYVGRGVAANVILQNRGLHPDPALEDYVNQVGQNLALASDRPETFQGYHFGVVGSDQTNAFAAPGGFVFVTTGALKHMKSEDELAGVLAHEIAHVNLRHPEEFANRETQKSGLMDFISEGGHLEQGAGFAAFGLGALGQAGAAQAVGTAGQKMARVVHFIGGLFDQFVQELWVNGYGRGSELAADDLAVDLLLRLKYDPNALKDFIARLPKADRGAWSTHPELADRVEKMEEKIRQRGISAPADPARTARFLEATAKLR